MYICAAENVGVKMRVEIGGKSIEGLVSEVHNPAPIPSPDRVRRGEVYEKVWAPLKLGAVDLAKGRTKLVVRALEIPGKQAFDLKADKVRQVK